MMKVLNILGLGFSLLFFPVLLQAQDIGKQYQQSVGVQALLYHGKLEKSYEIGYANTPYRPLEYTLGSLTYRGMEYKDIFLRLNCEQKHLVLQSPDRKYNIILLPEDAPRATIGEWDYVYLDKSCKAPSADYYMALFECNDWSIYKQYYVSNINKKYEGKRLLLDFSIKERVYLKKDGKWSVISNRNDFIKHFRKYKTELQDYCKEHKLRPNEKREKDWRKLAEYCETLIQP